MKLWSKLYINIASPARIKGNFIPFNNYELDVVCVPGEAPRVVDKMNSMKQLKRLAIQLSFRMNVGETLRQPLSWTVSGARWIIQENSLHNIFRPLTDQDKHLIVDLATRRAMICDSLAQTIANHLAS